MSKSLNTKKTAQLNEIDEQYLNFNTHYIEI